MASFTTVEDELILSVPALGETVDIAISGTYSMTIKFQVEQGAQGSGAWNTINTYSTDDATVAANYVTTARNQRVRLKVTVDTSGTATVTLTDSSVLSHPQNDIKDALGNSLLTFDQNGVTVASAVRRTDGVENVTAATITLTANEHAGRVVTLNRAAGVTVTMPAATGSGNVYTIFVGTTVTSNDNIIQAASSSDSFGGGVSLATDIAGVVMLTAATTDTITMSGTTTGGVLGSWVTLTDVASGKFMLDGFLVTTGAEATPFSAAV